MARRAVFGRFLVAALPTLGFLSEAYIWRLQQEGVNDANKAKSMLKKDKT